ncbi:MAG: phosphatidylserine decarboxylase, partial [Deltaproteobacteria bacterium]|nr:phosphatidylserine decarboxylase [Deltaproteobacteria bacterium]
RRLVAGARPLDPDPAALLSPCDGKVLDRGPVDMGGTLRIKGRLYRAGDLAGERHAEKYDGGDFAVIYLSPRDYHRVHAPASGRLVALEHVPGLLLPVNALGVRLVPQLFARNERLAFHFETDLFGPICLVMVGAVGVGRITVPFDDLTTNRANGSPTTRRFEPARSVARGDEIGTFHLGSTVVLFLAPGRASRSGPAPGEDVSMGRSIGRALESA